MSRFRVLVADDEPLARGMVASLLREDPEIATVVECGNPREIEAALLSEPPDIAFLDVEMPELTGLDIAGRLAGGTPAVVFVTAFSAYATRAFDVQAVDYVLKPFSDARFREALDRAKARVLDRRVREQSAAAQSGDGPGPFDGADEAMSAGFLERFSVRVGGRSVVIKLSDVVWIEAQDYYVRMHTRSGRHLVRATLTSLERRLDPRRFLRVHRGAVVNLDDVQGILDGEGIQVTLSDGTIVPVSRARRRKVQAVLRPRLRPEAKPASTL